MSGPVYFRKIVAGAVVSGGNPVGCPSPVVRPRRGTGRRGDAWSGAVHRAALSTALRGMPENAVPPRRRGGVAGWERRSCPRHRQLRQAQLREELVEHEEIAAS